MRILVCCRPTYDNAVVSIDARGGTAPDANVVNVGACDIAALDLASQIAAAAGGSVVAFCAGDAKLEDANVQRSVLGRGADELWLAVDDAFERQDAHYAAAAIKALCEKEPFDLVLCGEASPDYASSQMAGQLAAMLGWPAVGPVSEAVLEGDCLHVANDLESVREHLVVPLPAVLSVAAPVEPPEPLGMGALLAAAKKPVYRQSCDELLLRVRAGIEWHLEPGQNTVDSSTDMFPYLQMLEVLRSPALAGRLHKVVAMGDVDQLGMFCRDVLSRGGN